ncbi:hypothetical protein [Nesterenkonia jeotgali]|uniref:Secreted protein n=1 Tax=Nesterenkonia jeotgali TaxID=317018 RepID=A0A839FRM5_9MICC|nr:hypothetical protein [Nesterenkonia jeotgali]MBA8920962.1 hypothetical protein [Nesterenkonia jeotgali]
MLTRTWMPLLSAAGAALLLSSCAAEAPAADAPEAEVAEADAQTEATEADAVAAGSTDVEAGDSGAETSPSSQDPDAEFRGGQQIIGGEDGVEFFYIAPEDDDGMEVVHLYCDDDQALAEKAEHNAGSQPAGWPQDWDGSGAMPDPLCHPDYLQIDEWEHLESHSACWEGIETSTLVRAGQSQAEIDTALWEQSQARADWAPNPPGGNCAEQWAQHDGGDPEDYADRGNANDG